MGANYGAHSFHQCCMIDYSYAVCTVQPVGTPFTPVVVQPAVLFFTNVPVEATPCTQFCVYVFDGIVVNIALM